MLKPLVSIVVPTLNEELFIERCLRALTNQSVPRNRYEIIVSDSSSEDGTVEVAEQYADRVVVCRRQSAGFGRNFGSKFARSDVLGFIDADTVASERWVEGLLRGLRKAIACTGPVEALESDSLKLVLFYKWWSLQSKLSVLLNFPIFPGFNIGVRRQEFEAVGGFSMDNITAEDIDLGFKLKKRGRIAFSEEMKVKTSTRRLMEIPLHAYVANGVRFVLFRKSRGWNEHRIDF